MKKLIVLLGGMIIAAGAAAQADRSGASPAQPVNSVERQVPLNSERDKRENPAREGPESANIVDPDFQGSSKQETTASGLGQPKKSAERAAAADKTRPDMQGGQAVRDVQDVEDKARK